MALLNSLVHRNARRVQRPTLCSQEYPSELNSDLELFRLCASCQLPYFSSHLSPFFTFINHLSQRSDFVNTNIVLGVNTIPRLYLNIDPLQNIPSPTQTALPHSADTQVGPGAHRGNLNSRGNQHHSFPSHLDQ